MCTILVNVTNIKNMKNKKEAISYTTLKLHFSRATLFVYFSQLYCLKDRIQGL